MPCVIALDAMGSDRAPKPEIEGAIYAARSYGVRVLLVGPEAIVKAELVRHPAAARLRERHDDPPQVTEHDPRVRLSGSGRQLHKEAVGHWL